MIGRLLAAWRWLVGWRQTVRVKFVPRGTNGGILYVSGPPLDRAASAELRRLWRNGWRPPANRWVNIPVSVLMVAGAELRDDLEPPRTLAGSH